MPLFVLPIIRVARPAVAVLAGLVLLNRSSQAQPASTTGVTAPRVIEADVRREAGPLNRMFQQCVGAGRANEGLRADWQQQLAYVHRECGFTYLRMHGLLTDDMGVYSEGKNGAPIYNWQYVDVLYDYLLSIGMKPFVEFGFMPNALASGTQTCFWWKGNVTVPKDWKKWEDLIHATVAHWTERYGAAEVKSWYFEVWNEPNLKYFFAGTQPDYFRMYEATCRAVKTVDASYRVGGPATAGCAWVTEFLAFCSANHVPVDFVSTHNYAVEEGFVDETGNKGTVFSANRHSISGDVRRVRGHIQDSAYPDLPLHFTEWSTSYTPFDPIHDSYHSAAFIVDRIRQTGNAAQSLSYWVFTDIFEEPGPRATPFHGGFGLLNYQGINKPAFYAFQYLNKLGETELSCADSNSWVAKNAAGGIQVLAWDYTHTHPGKTVNNQEFYLRDLPPSKSTPVVLSVKNVRPGRYALNVYRVGYRMNDAQATYRDLGSPSQLTRAQVAYIKSVNSGTPVEQTLLTIGPDGVFHREYVLRENDVCLVELIPM